MELLKLNVTNVNGVQTMSSLELAKLCVGDGTQAHRDFVKKLKNDSCKAKIQCFMP